jgi:hypothetical protein
VGSDSGRTLIAKRAGFTVSRAICETALALGRIKSWPALFVLGRAIRASVHRPNPTGEGSVPNITQHPNGLADWSEADIETLLESGITPQFDSVSGDMKLVVRNIAQLAVADRKAMAHYLKTIEPTTGARGN